MDCREFDEQVVRLERIRDIADQFVRVRLTRIEGLDLNLFEFDFDLTMMVFFLNADEKMYARYGQRDAEGPDTRQSLEGLHYTMQSVLKTHEQEQKVFAPREREVPQEVRDMAAGRGGRGCMHCHQVKERMNSSLRRAGKLGREQVWRYPLPDNLGLILEVARGNIVEQVKPDTPAAQAGLRKGDVVRQLGGVPIHSIADAQFALDRAPAKGEVAISWTRDDTAMSDKLVLFEEWRRSDISWRRSMFFMVPSARLSGRDLTAEEKQLIGVGEKQLAFRQQYPVHSQAQTAGVREGDIIVGIDNKKLNLDCFGFLHYVRQSYLTGDHVTVQIVRDGQRLSLPMTLR